MEWFLESIYPTLIVVVCGLALTAILFVQTGKRVFLVGMIAVVALAGLMLFVEQVVVTDREQIEDTVDGLALALEANDVGRVLSFISTEPDAKPMRDRAEGALAIYRILKAKIRDMKVQVRPIAGEATAEFDGILSGEFKASPGAGPYARRFTLKFRREPENGGPWKTYAFEDRNMLGQ